jgi:hypothetical protein
MTEPDKIRTFSEKNKISVKAALGTLTEKAKSSYK